MPRSHLPEIPDVRAQAILAQWKTDLIDALRRERLDRLSSSHSRGHPGVQTPRSKSPKPTKLYDRRPYRSTTTNSGTSKASEPVSSAIPQPTLPRTESTISVGSTESSNSTHTEPRVVEVNDEESHPPDNTWRNTAWTIGSRVLYEALAALGREHNVRTEQRQLNMRLAAATAQQNQQFWSSVATWGAWSAQTALQYYFGSTGSRGNNLIGNG